MKPSCAFSIVVLFVTGLSMPLVASQNSTNSTTETVTSDVSNSTNSSTTAASTTAATTASTPSTTTTTSQTTTPTTFVCILHTCNWRGCLANATNTGNCTGQFCTMVQRSFETSYNITAGCASNCTEKDVPDGNFTVRTRCCHSNKCNNDDLGIVALPTGNGGSASSQTLFWILSIMLFIAAFEILS